MREPTARNSTSLSPAEVQRAADSLLAAERARTPRRPLTERNPDLSVEDAYAIQQAYARRRLDGGARLIGHKIGATSEAIQRLFGVATPDFGHLFDDMLVAEGDAIPVASLIQPLVEPEIAFVLDRELAGPGVSEEDVVAATRGVVPCIEVIDSRIEEWRIRLADTVADNGSSARFLVGDTLVPLGALDLAAEEVELRRNGEVVERGRGDAVLGHPATSVAWLANALGAFGEALPRDAYVLSGSLTTALRARAGERYEAVFASIGRIACTFS